MQKISYSEPYGMQQAVFEGYKEMTRREPIYDEIKDPRTEFDTRGHLRLYDGDNGACVTVCDMAERKEKQMIDKACEYLRSHIDPDLIIYHNTTFKKVDDFIRDFRKAMDEKKS